jgi:hypothetical protein
MSKHDAAYIKKFQPKESATPVMDAVYDLLKIKDRHRKHRASKKLKRTRNYTWY